MGSLQPTLSKTIVTVNSNWMKNHLTRDINRGNVNLQCPKVYERNEKSC